MIHRLTILVVALYISSHAYDLSANCSHYWSFDNVATRSGDTTVQRREYIGMVDPEAPAKRYFTVLHELPVEKGSFRLDTDGVAGDQNNYLDAGAPEQFTDNGSGTLSGADGGSGTIDYTSGELDIAFATAPPAELRLFCYFDKKFSAVKRFPPSRGGVAAVLAQYSGNGLEGRDRHNSVGVLVPYSGGVERSPGYDGPPHSLVADDYSTGTSRAFRPFMGEEPNKNPVFAFPGRSIGSGTAFTISLWCSRDAADRWDPTVIWSRSGSNLRSYTNNDHRGNNYIPRDYGKRPYMPMVAEIDGTNINTHRSMEPLTWYHVVLSRKTDGTAAVFVNGDEVTDDPNAKAGGVFDLEVVGADYGSWYGYGRNMWNGPIDEMRVYSYAAGFPEVKGMYEEYTGKTYGTATVRVAIDESSVRGNPYGVSGRQFTNRPGLVSPSNMARVLGRSNKSVLTGVPSVIGVEREPGYHFDHWTKSGSADFRPSHTYRWVNHTSLKSAQATYDKTMSPVEIVANGDASFTAHLAINTHQFKVTANRFDVGEIRPEYVRATDMNLDWKSFSYGSKWMTETFTDTVAEFDTVVASARVTREHYHFRTWNSDNRRLAKFNADGSKYQYRTEGLVFYNADPAKATAPPVHATPRTHFGYKGDQNRVWIKKDGVKTTFDFSHDDTVLYRTLKAVFAPDTYNVVIDLGKGGDYLNISNDKGHILEENVRDIMRRYYKEIVTLEAVPREHYTFTHWRFLDWDDTTQTEDSVFFYANTHAQSTNPILYFADSAVVVAHFVPDTFTLTVDMAGQGGHHIELRRADGTVLAPRPDGTFRVAYEDTFAISGVPVNNQCEFVKWASSPAESIWVESSTERETRITLRGNATLTGEFLFNESGIPLPHFIPAADHIADANELSVEIGIDTATTGKQPRIRYWIEGTADTLEYADALHFGRFTTDTVITIRAQGMVEELFTSYGPWAGKTYTVTLPRLSPPVASLAPGYVRRASACDTLRDTSSATDVSIQFSRNEGESFRRYESPVCFGPFEADTEVALWAYNTAPGYRPSDTVSFEYLFQVSSVAAPSIAPAGGRYTRDALIDVEITDPSERESVVLYYTLDGISPVTGGAEYPGGPLEVALSGIDSVSVSAVAYDPQYGDAGYSEVVTVEFRRVARVTDAVYRDADGDGRIERAVLTFDVPLPRVPDSVALRTPDGDWLTVAGEELEAQSERVVRANISPALDAATEVEDSQGRVLDGALFDTTVFAIDDGAGPVVISARYFPYDGAGLQGHDTIRVSFSEPITVNSTQFDELFEYYRAETDQPDAEMGRLVVAVEQSATDEMAIVVRRSDTFAILPNSDRIAAAQGAPIADKSDNGIIDRHRELVQVGRRLTIRLVVSPNPFNPGGSVVPGAILSLAPAGTPSQGIVGRFQAYFEPEATAGIYDAVGNRIASDLPLFGPRGSTIRYFVWDGRNDRGRRVGSGSYLLVVDIQDKAGVEPAQAVKKLIGVRW